MKQNQLQWLSATVVLFSFDMQAADASGAYKVIKVINSLTVPNAQVRQVPTALAVDGNTVAVGFALNVTRLHNFTDEPVEGTPSINAFQHVGEENPRTVAVAFLPDDPQHSLCTVNRIGTISYLPKPYNKVAKVRSGSTSTFCMKVTKELLCLGFDNDEVWVLEHQGLLKRRCRGVASGHVNAVEMVDNMLVSGNYDGTIALFDIESQTAPTTIGKHGEKHGALHCMAKQNAALIYTGGSDQLIKVWDIRAKHLLATTFQHGTTYALAILKSGYLAAGSNDNKVSIFDLRGIIRQPIEIVDAGNGTDVEYNHTITALAATDNGGFVSAISNGVVKVWK